MEDSPSDDLNPHYPRAVAILVLCLAFTACMVCVTHWSLVTERAWMVTRNPEQELNWIQATTLMLHVLLWPSLLMAGFAIWQIAKPAIERSTRTWVIMGTGVVYLLAEGGLIYYFFQHWNQYQ